MLRHANAFLKIGFCVLFGASPASSQVLITEIHYHPPAPHGKTLEFVEIHNSGDAAVEIGGWSFLEGLDFEFPAAAVLPAGGYAVVAKDVQVFRSEYGDLEGVYGNFQGSLQNDGESIALADAHRAIVDFVDYDDEFPWPEFADGSGASLQRRCVSEASHRVDNWMGSPADDVSPAAPAGRAMCPLPARETPPIVFSEIHYHPFDDNDESEEYVELHNRSEESVDLQGWSFDEGVQFTFEDALIVPAGGYVIVCRNLGALSQRFDLPEGFAVGNFAGELSNLGERLSLIDADGAAVDSVTYRDQGEWSYGPDGLGRSLEKIQLDAPSSDPASWSHSEFQAEGFEHVQAVGSIADLFTQRLLLGINGRGEYIIDNVFLARVDDPDVNLIETGDFETDSNTWQGRGNSETSRLEDGIGVDGSRALRLISTGGCTTVCGSVDSFAHSFTRGLLDADAEYILALDFLHVSGGSQIYASMLRGVAIQFDALNLTPGRVNTIDRASIPPFVSRISRSIAEPDSSDSVWLTAHVRSPSTLSRVMLSYFRADAALQDEVSILMFDDGKHRDGFADDGVFGAEVPPQPHNSQLHYRILAETTDGQIAISPRPFDGGPSEVWGYYVNDSPAATSPLPVYHLLIPGADPSDPQAINSVLNCSSLLPGGFAYKGTIYPDVGFRWRGNTACWIQKRNFKIKFQRGRDFLGLRKVNLQGIWTDKALVREHLAWQFVDEIGIPAVDTEYIRVHLNGQYHGLFLYLEHPDQRWLDREDGMDGDGCLYKAKQPNTGQTPIGVARQTAVNDYERFWERETCESEDLTGLAGFIGDLHSQQGRTAEFMDTRTFREWTIGYQIAQIALNNIDSFAKNHFLYGDPDEDRWAIICWDFDLTFGKFFDPGVVDSFPDGLRPVGTLNDCMLSDQNRDLNPWFTTRVNGNRLLHNYTDRFMTAENGIYQRAYLVRLWDVLQEKFSNAAMDPIVDDLVGLIGDEAQEDLERWGRYVSHPTCRVPDSLDANIDILKGQITKHRSFLLAYFRDFHPEIRNHARAKITEIMYNPEGASEDLEFVEITNITGAEINLQGWALRDGIDFFFIEETLLAPDEIIVVARDPELFGLRYSQLLVPRVYGPYSGSLSNGGEGIRLVDAGPGYPATIDFVRYRDGGCWPDIRDGRSIELTMVSANRDNDRGEAWKMSTSAGGTPGTLVDQVPFVRGDVAGDGASLTDAVFILNWLFRSGDVPSCLKSADANDDGRIQLSDPIYLLNFLFLGGEAIPAPYPDRGADPTEDGLSCLSYGRIQD